MCPSPRHRGGCTPAPDQPTPQQGHPLVRRQDAQEIASGEGGTALSHVRALHPGRSLSC